VEDGESPRTDDLLQLFLDLLNMREKEYFDDLMLTETFLFYAFQLFDDPLEALKAATQIVRKEVPGRPFFGFALERSVYHYTGFTDFRLDDTGFGDLRDYADRNQVSHFIGEAYISLWVIRHSPKRMSLVGFEPPGLQPGMDGSLFIWANEAQNFGQSYHHSNIDYDLGMISNQMAWDIYRTGDTQKALTTAISSIMSYRYNEQHPGNPGPGFFNLTQQIGHLFGHREE